MKKRGNRSHYTMNGSPKKGYRKEMDAVIVCYKINSDPLTIHQHVHYKCVTCGLWHIGKTNRELTDEMRSDYAARLKRL